MWPRNIQNGFEIVRASLGFEPDTFGVESNRFTNSATPSIKLILHYFNYRQNQSLAIFQMQILLFWHVFVSNKNRLNERS